VATFLNLFHKFSKEYAAGVTAVVGFLGFILAVATLLFLYRDYSLKYRPYVVPGVTPEQIQDSKAVNVLIKPNNVGSYPCYIKITNIRFRVGDEEYQTPDMPAWQLLGPTQGRVGIAMPAGHVNELGVQKIREARYKVNRTRINSFDST
jgi:hypothetical protein